MSSGHFLCFLAQFSGLMENCLTPLLCKAATIIPIIIIPRISKYAKDFLMIF